MSILSSFLDKINPLFEKGGSLERFFPFFEMVDTFLYTPAESAAGSVHIRDSIDLKRMMIIVITALIPCILFTLYNTGFQANLIISKLMETGEAEVLSLNGWRYWIINWSGLGYNPESAAADILHGALIFCRF